MLIFFLPLQLTDGEDNGSASNTSNVMQVFADVCVAVALLIEAAYGPAAFRGYFDHLLINNALQTRFDYLAASGRPRYQQLHVHCHGS